MSMKSIFRKILSFFLPKTVNYGVLEVPPTKTDFIADVRGGLITTEINPTGDWADYLPLEEAQNSVYMDSYACVSFSALNCISTQLNYMLHTGKMSDATIQKMIDLGYIQKKL